MGKLLDFLKGKKTYVIGILMAIGTFAQYMGWIDTAAWEKITGFLAGIGLITLRSAISKTTK